MLLIIAIGSWVYLTLAVLAVEFDNKTAGRVLCGLLITLFCVSFVMLATSSLG